MPREEEDTCLKMIYFCIWRRISLAACLRPGQTYSSQRGLRPLRTSPAEGVLGSAHNGLEGIPAKYAFCRLPSFCPFTHFLGI